MSKQILNNNFYVYVYIDPRNFHEFYYGKGQGNRKLAHLSIDDDSEKTLIIKEIEKEGLQPIIKVVARNLSEEQAFLIEKTLIWKLGKTLTNRSSGHFAENFRPHQTLHKDLYGFDYENGVYCINIGEGAHRSWEDCRKYSFISAGQNWKRWGSRICSLRPNDILCAYLSKYGYVGVARVLDSACPAIEFKHDGRLLSTFPLKQPRMFEVNGDVRDAEYTLKVEWIVSRDRNNSVGGDLTVWRARSMLGSMEAQPKTLKFLEVEFGINFGSLLSNGKKDAA